MVYRTALVQNRVEGITMLNYQFRLDTAYKRQLENRLKLSQQIGKVQQVKRLLAILSLAKGIGIETTAATLNVSEESIRSWFKSFLHQGVRGLASSNPLGRPPKLSRQQKRELTELIKNGPVAAGYTSGCWRSPIIQHLIEQRYGISYSVHYVCQLLKSLGFSYQKARFVSDHLDKKKRQEWLELTWPHILRLAQQKRSYILFGDEASFPQWGSLSYTWAQIGEQPEVKTSGKRKSYKVFGLIDYFTGRFFSKCIEGRLCSESYQSFLKEVLAQTRKHIILIQDGAKYHGSKAMLDFFALNKDRLTVFNLPTYSPDFNPIEMLWKKIKQKEIHLHYFPTFDSLIDRVNQALLKFQFSPQEVLSLFGLYEKLLPIDKAA